FKHRKEFRAFFYQEVELSKADLVAIEEYVVEVKSVTAPTTRRQTRPQLAGPSRDHKVGTTGVVDEAALSRSTTRRGPSGTSRTSREEQDHQGSSSAALHAESSRRTTSRTDTTMMASTTLLVRDLDALTEQILDMQRASSLTWQLLDWWQNLSTRATAACLRVRTACGAMLFSSSRREGQDKEQRELNSARRGRAGICDEDHEQVLRGGKAILLPIEDEQVAPTTSQVEDVVANDKNVGNGRFSSARPEQRRSRSINNANAAAPCRDEDAFRFN
ncbi:unnamed protein product, partial [Amoebophrya sp. A120]